MLEFSDSTGWETISNGLATNGQVCTYTFTNNSGVEKQFFRLVFP
jgi:hypothetical protein